VVVKDGATVKQAHRGELALGDHAEYTALERKLGDKDLTGVTIVTTLEPCTKRGHERTPCAERIILRRVARVVIGMLDPNPSMQGKGVYMLKKAGIQVAFCSKPLEDEIKQLNKEFIEDQLSRIETIQPARFDEQFRHVYAVLFSHGGMPLPNYRRIINRKTKQGFLIGEYANRLLESGKIEVITETWTGERAFEEWFGKNGITPIDTEAKRTDLVASKLIGFHITSTTDWFEIGIRNGRLLEPVKQEINKGTIKFIGYDQPDRFHVNQGDSRLLTITIEANFELGSRTLFMRKGDYGYVEFSLYQNEEYDSENEAYRLPVETKQYLHYRSLAEKNEKEYPIPEEIL
jgi:pyrimidine deaminase RibD-like protein